jgi:hypothetical protein
MEITSKYQSFTYDFVIALDRLHGNDKGSWDTLYLRIFLMSWTTPRAFDNPLSIRSFDPPGEEHGGVSGYAGWPTRWMVAWNWLEMTAMNSLEASILRGSKSRTTTQGIPSAITFHRLRPTDIFNKDRCIPLQFSQGLCPSDKSILEGVEPQIKRAGRKGRTVKLEQWQFNFINESSYSLISDFSLPLSVQLLGENHMK